MAKKKPTKAKKKPTKDEILLGIVNQLKTLPVAQLMAMLKIVEMAGNAAMQISEASQKTGMDIGIGMNLYGRKKDGKQPQLN